MQSSNDQINVSKESSDYESLSKEAVSSELQQEPNNAKLQEFISKTQLKWRKTFVYQQYPFKPIAQYVRNSEYKPELLRTATTLSACIDYLIKNILDLIQNQKYKTIDTIAFLENSFRAIRCEYHVQNILNLQALQKIVQCNIIATQYNEDSLAEVRATLDTFYNTLLNRNGKEKIRLIYYALLLSAKSFQYERVLNLLEDQIRQSKETQRLLKICNSIRLNRFWQYFGYLNEIEYFEGCILYTYCNEMRVYALKCFAKSQLNISVKELVNILYFDNSAQLLRYLKILGYNVENYEKQLQADLNSQFFINLKIPLANFKAIDRNLMFSQKLKAKRGGKKLSELIS